MDHVTRNPMYRFLVVTSIASMTGLQTWLIIFNNFAVEQAGLEGHHIGIIQSVREIPGFLTFLVVYAILCMKEHRLSSVSILALGFGLAMTGFFPTFGGILGTTLIMSFGFHYYETTNQSLTLQYFDAHVSPWVFGKLRSFAAAASIGTGIFIYAMVSVASYSTVYLLLGGAIVLAGLWSFLQDPVDRSLPSQRKTMVVRKKYWLFYFLTFMAGARRQIFMAFAVFLLVKQFRFSVKEVTALFVLTNLLTYFLGPLIGRAIIRFGERAVLSLEYSSLIFIFIAYATVTSKGLLAFLYVMDHLVFNCAIAIRTYFQKVSDPRDIAPSMAVGFTINHIAAVVLPALGGLLWIIDYRIPFFVGAAFSLVSLTAVQLIRVPKGASSGMRSGGKG